jgi:uncharacterized protein
MKKNILFKTSSGNNYFFNLKSQVSFLLHPILNYLLELDNKGIDLNIWFANIDENCIKNDYIGLVSKEDIKYYLSKYEFMKVNGQLDEFNLEEIIEFKLNENQIKSYIANSLDVAFEVTEKCNLNCTYCVYGQIYEGYEVRENKNLSFEKAKNLLDF